MEEDSSWEALESRPEHSVNPNAIGDSNFITLSITSTFAEADGHGSVYVSRGVYCDAAVARPDHLSSPPRLIVLRALRSNSCHLAPAKARAPSSKHASPKPTRDHPCCRRSSKVDITESEIAKILTPHLMFMRWLFHFKPRPALQHSTSILQRYICSRHEVQTVHSPRTRTWHQSLMLGNPITTSPTPCGLVYWAAL